jgi:hypothetical protein
MSSGTVSSIRKSFSSVPALTGVLFAASVLVRLPNINRPLSEHHDWPKAHFLRTQRIWYEAGALLLFASGLPGGAMGPQEFAFGSVCFCLCVTNVQTTRS